MTLHWTAQGKRNHGPTVILDSATDGESEVVVVNGQASSITIYLEFEGPITDGEVRVVSASNENYLGEWSLWTEIKADSSATPAITVSGSYQVEHHEAWVGAFKVVIASPLVGGTVKATVGGLA